MLEKKNATYLICATPCYFVWDRLERVWDPILVPGAKRNISYYFLKEVLSIAI
jgi:hypothetical protein